MSQAESSGSHEMLPAERLAAPIGLATLRLEQEVQQNKPLAKDAYPFVAKVFDANEPVLYRNLRTTDIPDILTVIEQAVACDPAEALEPVEKAMLGLFLAGVDHPQIKALTHTRISAQTAKRWRGNLIERLWQLDKTAPRLPQENVQVRRYKIVHDYLKKLVERFDETKSNTAPIVRYSLPQMLEALENANHMNAAEHARLRSHFMDREEVEGKDPAVPLDNLFNELQQKLRDKDQAQRPGATAIYVPPRQAITLFQLLVGNNRDGKPPMSRARYVASLPKGMQRDHELDDAMLGDVMSWLYLKRP